ACSVIPQCYPGATFRSEWTLHNPYKETVRYDLGFRASGKIRVSPALLSGEIPPGKNALIHCDLSSGEENVQPGEKIWLSVSGHLKPKNRKPFPVRSTIPVRPVQTLKHGFSSKANFVMSEMDQVMSFFVADPKNLNKLWSGPEDLSGKIWMAATENALCIEVEVVDDLHVNAEKGNLLWKGDSLQLFLQIPGQNGIWEMGFALHDDRSCSSCVWKKPQGCEIPSKIPFRIVEKNRKIFYSIQLPYAALHTSRKQLSLGFRFNLLVNDNDLGIREGWIAVAGAHNAREIECFPSLRCQ
ncbi:MAG: hypothetical protein PHS41_10710, partial [Victivallaceae bacterium]|nr:hypothetical protein [Victivallaceae bacterium]